MHAYALQVLAEDKADLPVSPIVYGGTAFIVLTLLLIVTLALNQDR